MKQFIALIRERNLENTKWTDYFIVENSENPEQNFRKAVKEYLLTEDGKEDIKMNSGYFNWGDAIINVPDEIWKNHNIIPVYQSDNIEIVEPTEIIVDQDEVLIYGKLKE